MIRLETLSASRLDAFVASHPTGHYMKTSMWAQLEEKKGARAHFFGLTDRNTLVGTAMMLEVKKPGIHYYYIPWGPCLDYNNVNLVREAFSAFIHQAEKDKVDFLRIDPNVLRMARDIKGNPIEGGENHEEITELLKELGFRHKGYGYAYNGSWVNRFTLIIELNDAVDQLVRRFSKARQNSLRRHAVIGVSTVVGGTEDLDALCEFERQLSEIQGFKPHSRAFFEDLIAAFGKHAVLYVTRLDLNQMIEGIQQEIDSGKYHKDPEALASKQKEKEKAALLKEKYGDCPKIAAGLFLRLGAQSWDLYTYNHKDFNFIKAADNLHRFAVEDMKNHGVRYYDMCGFSGVTEKSDPYFGLYDYKKSFGSVYTERIGEFDFIFHPSRMERWQKTDHFVRRVRRKVNALRYGKKEKTK